MAWVVREFAVVGQEKSRHKRHDTKRLQGTGVARGLCLMKRNLSRQGGLSNRYGLGAEDPDLGRLGWRSWFYPLEAWRVLFPHAQVIEDLSASGGLARLWRDLFHDTLL